MTGVHHHPDHGAGRSRLLLSPRSRRAFLGEIGGGALALALVSPALLAACSSSEEEATDTATSDTATSGTAASDSAAPDAETSDATASGAGSSGEAQEASPDGLRWARTNLGFVSAYVLVRGNRAAVVDTGVEGSADAIGQSLQDLGLTYNDVESVILTHKHGDHVGSIVEVLGRAVNATAYAGQADLEEIPGPDNISPLVGGEDIFGLEMLATPGHTPGHMAAIDHGAGILIAGDALRTEGAAVVEGPANFTEDLPTSHDSIRDLAQLTFNTLLVGHGEPLESAADQAVARLADSLG